jgi:uncharacterized membrane protein YgaE (UPF0421/DUF939 family)
MTLTPDALITLAVPPLTGPDGVFVGVGVGVGVRVLVGVGAVEVGVGVFSASPQLLKIRALKTITVKSTNSNFFIDVMLPPLLIPVIRFIFIFA